MLSDQSMSGTLDGRFDRLSDRRSTRRNSLRLRSDRQGITTGRKRTYSRNPVASVQNDSRSAHPGQKGVHDLHGILRGRKIAVILLKNQPDTLALEPTHCVVVIERAEQPLHKFLTSWISG